MKQGTEQEHLTFFIIYFFHKIMKYTDVWLNAKVIQNICIVDWEN